MNSTQQKKMQRGLMYEIISSDYITDPAYPVFDYDGKFLGCAGQEQDNPFIKQSHLFNNMGMPVVAGGFYILRDGKEITVYAQVVQEAKVYWGIEGWGEQL